MSSAKGTWLPAIRFLSFLGLISSLPELMDFILFGKTILVVNKKFGLFLVHPLRKRVSASFHVNPLIVRFLLAGDLRAAREKMKWAITNPIELPGVVEKRWPTASTRASENPADDGCWIRFQRMRTSGWLFIPDWFIATFSQSFGTFRWPTPNILKNPPQALSDSYEKRDKAPM